MKRAIVIGTWPGAAEQLEALLHSLKGTRWPIVIVVNGGKFTDEEWFRRIAANATVFVNDRDDGWELGAIATVLECTTLDEFLFLQDTFEVKDLRFIDEVMEHPDSVALGSGFFHYAGKWKRSVLEQMEIPEVHSKFDSVHFEHDFTASYFERTPVWVFDQDFHDGENKGFVEKYGRTNMLLENRWFRKYKGDWGQRELHR